MAATTKQHNIGCSHCMLQILATSQFWHGIMTLECYQSTTSEALVSGLHNIPGLSWCLKNLMVWEANLAAEVFCPMMLS